MSDRPHEVERSPRISFGVPVRNEEACIFRCLDSILAQHWTDFEVVISDNASTDRTPDILKEYAARDPRIRLYLNEEDIGQIENCNSVVHLSQGKYFKWVGGDDWLEPTYASACVAAFDQDPLVIAVTTGFANHDDQGNTVYRPYRGELLESPRPSRRFARMLWCFYAGDSVYDPVYGIMRRDILLERTSLLRMMERADAMLAAELSLVGRFAHIPDCLMHRYKPYREMEDRETLLRGYHPTRYRELPASTWRHLRVLAGIVRKASVPRRERMRCIRPMLTYSWKRAYRRMNKHLRRFARERLGISRQRIPFLRRSADRRQ